MYEIYRLSLRHNSINNYMLYVIHESDHKAKKEFQKLERYYDIIDDFEFNYITSVEEWGTTERTYFDMALREVADTKQTYKYVDSEVIRELKAIQQVGETINSMLIDNNDIETDFIYAAIAELFNSIGE